MTSADRAGAAAMTSQPTTGNAGGTPVAPTEAPASNVTRAPGRVPDQALHALLGTLSATVAAAPGIAARGRVVRVIGILIHAAGVRARLGELCALHTPGLPTLWAEVVGFERDSCVLTPLGAVTGLSTDTEVVATGMGHTCPVGDGLLGRVVDALGVPLDGRGPLQSVSHRASDREAGPAMLRRPIRDVLKTGIRAIDALLTMGEGQRVGIFAPPGVGKSTLLGMLARGSSADVNVVALIGERGREVKEFIENALGDDSLRRTVLVVSTSDRPAMERIKCAYTATTVAEHFRSQGRSVLLLMDSLTRFARAQREIGLASGEPPTRRSYPPSIFSMLPKLLERGGQGETGAITAAYTVLTEGDEENDPIAEEVRSILDGHIALSRDLAAAGHFPAIDVPGSVSRVMPALCDARHLADAAHLRALMAKYEEVKLLVRIGEYAEGSDPMADDAVTTRDAITDFLTQPAEERTPWEDTLQRLAAIAPARQDAEEA